MVDYFMVNQVCGRGNWGFCFFASESLVGGILCCWNKTVFQVTKCVLAQRLVVIKERLMDDKGPNGLIYVCASTDDNEKATFFSILDRVC